MRNLFIVPALALGLAVIVAGCGTPQRQEDEAAGAIKKFKAKDPSLKRFFDDSAGYVIFPAASPQGPIAFPGGRMWSTPKRTPRPAPRRARTPSQLQEKSGP